MRSLMSSWDQLYCTDLCTGPYNVYLQFIMRHLLLLLVASWQERRGAGKIYCPRTVAGDVVQAAPGRDGSTSFMETTTPRLLTFGDEPRHVDIRGWRYGPRRLRVNDDDDDSNFSLSKTFHLVGKSYFKNTHFGVKILHFAEIWGQNWYFEHA